MNKNRIRGRQIADSDFVSEDELASRWKSHDIGEEHGFQNIFPVAIDSVDGVSRTIVAGNARFKSWQAQKGDIVEIVGGAADGDYTVDEVISQTEIKVVEPISAASSGDLTIYHPPGAEQVGVRNDQWTNLSGDNVQEVLGDVDTQLGNISGGGVGGSDSNGISFISIAFDGVAPEGISTLISSFYVPESITLSAGPEGSLALIGGEDISSTVVLSLLPVESNTPSATWTRTGVLGSATLDAVATLATGWYDIVLSGSGNKTAFARGIYLIEED